MFYDDSALLIHDPLHSDDEDRFILLGMTFSNKVLVVCHCYKAADNIIRIISTRKAGKHEKEQYKARR